MVAFNWLHLSDLHLGMGGQAHLWPNIRDQFFEDLTELHEICGPWDAVLFTGDFVQKGSKEEFDKLDELLDQLWAHLKPLGSTPVLLAVPGNHDLVRPNPKKAAVRMLKKWDDEPDIQVELWQEPDCEYRELIEQAFANYEHWWKNTPLKGNLVINHGLLPGDFSASWTKDGLKIGLVGLNTSFLQLDSSDYHQKLAWDARQFHKACADDGTAWVKEHHACLLMTHQPPDWLNTECREGVYSEINPAGRFAAHLFGHMHENAIRNSAVGGGNVVRHWQGSSLFGLEQYGNALQRIHGYSAGRIELKDGKALLRHWPRLAHDDKTNGWRFIPDNKSAILKNDNGTKAEVIDQLRPWSDNPLDQNETPPNVKLADQQSESRYKQSFLNKYQDATLRQCDIIQLNRLPEGDRDMAMKRLLMRQLYVPLRITLEVDNEDAEALEQSRQSMRLYNAGRGGEGKSEGETHPVAKRLGESRRLVILGDPGAGKTTLLRWFATAFLLRLTNNPDFDQMPDIDSLPEQPWLPLVVRCRELDTQCLQSCTLDDILRRTLQKAELESGELELKLLRNELAAGRLILLIDGLDEIVDPTLRASFCAQLERISDTYREAPMIVTSRIVGYREMGYPIGKGFEHGVLAELTKEDKDDFIHLWCAVTENKDDQSRAKKELIDAVHTSDRIERLTGNPMMLTTMALVKRKVGKLPTRRNELYREAVGVLLNWRSDIYGAVDDREAYPQLEYIAYAMCDRGVQQLRRDEIIGLLEDVRRDFPNIRTIQGRTPEEFLTVMEAQTGLIVEVGEQLHDGHINPVYEFRHLTFQEYLAGLALIAGPFPGYDSRTTLGGRLSPLAGLVVANIYGEFEVTENWREAIRLCIACCNNNLVDEALLAVLQPVNGEDDKQTFKPRAILALFCLADEPNVSENIGLEIISCFVQALGEERGFSPNASQAGKELAVSCWKEPILTKLIDSYVSTGPSFRQSIGNMFSWIKGAELHDSKLNIASWKEQQIYNLQQSEEIAIRTALSIMHLTFKGKLQVYEGVIEPMLQLLGRSDSMSSAGAWALWWFSGGYAAERLGRWEPQPNEVTCLVEYLGRPDADVEALIYIALIFKNHAEPQVIEPCIALLKNEYRWCRKAAVEALGITKIRRATDAVILTFDDDENEVRCAALGILALHHEDEINCRLLSRFCSGSSPWLDPQKEIKQSYIDRAIKKLEISKEEVISRLRTLAGKYDLTLSF